MGLLTILAKILLTAIGSAVLLLVFSSIHHTSRLKREAEKFPPPGKVVQVNHTKMHVYSEGQGPFLLVFMGGHGTSSPTIDFKPLWKKMSDENRIIVTERAGYGWSEHSQGSRDIDTILEETRKALELSGEIGPYVLVPHSMSGLEAIYWAQKYPLEVKAIIGLDPAIPDVYEESSELITQKRGLKIMHFLTKTGVSRWMDRKELEKNLPLLGSKEWSEQDKETALALFYRSAISKNMLNEIDCIPGNAKKVKSNPAPVHTPMYFFISDGHDVLFPDWQKQLSNYVSELNFGKFTYLECGHYVHHEKSDVIAKEAKRFLREIEGK